MNQIFRSCLLGLAFTITTGAEAEVLGRLFFTPEQRAQLEYDQQQSGTTQEGAHTLTVNGVVQKHGGKRTVWINGVSQPVDKSDESAPESMLITVAGQLQPARIKVGQKISINPATPGQ